MVLGATIFLYGSNAPFAIDVWWNDLLVQARHGFLLWISYAMNWLGGGWFGVFGAPILISGCLLIARRPWGAVYFLAAEIVSAGLVQLLKHLFGRARPDDIIVVSDFGSFPSGHVANAATIAVVLFILFPRVWVGVAGAAWVMLMAFSRTYLGAHWLSDTVGGALLGASAALLVFAPFRGPLVAESARRQDAETSGPSLG
ncbi:phospholipid phosphatase [Microbacterium sp. Root61]|nr:phospholipid phosphatase [Microbacterium sp. Root61]